MKGLVLGLIISMFILNPIPLIIAEECELALPRYGVIECYDMGDPDSIDIYLEHNEEEKQSTGSFVCISDCNLNTLDLPQDLCGSWWSPHLAIFKNEELVFEKSSIGEIEEKNIHLDYGDELLIIGYCRKIIPTSPLYIDKIQIQQNKVMLKESWAGSLPFRTIQGTEDCVLNKEIEEDTNINSYLDVNSGIQEDKPSSTYNSLSEFTDNWEVGDNYVFVKDWQTGIADISLTYDKNNNHYWCGGQYGSRKIYEVDEVISSTGKCYAVPQSIKTENAECCFPVDCIDSFGAEYTCNPDNWKCEKTKPCNSQVECDSVFGEGVCQDNKINKWVCDLTKKWGDYAGTCVHSSKQVSECPSDCSNKEYYNEEQGKCLTRASLPSSPITGEATGEGKSSSTGLIILIIFLILIGGAIGFYFYNKKTTPSKPKSKSETSSVKEEPKEIPQGKFCIKCGSPLREEVRFCTKCGGWVRR